VAVEIMTSSHINKQCALKFILAEHVYISLKLKKKSNGIEMYCMISGSHSGTDEGSRFSSSTA
jgi:hypothetical protein